MAATTITYHGTTITKRVTTTQTDYFIPDLSGPGGCVLQFDTLAEAKACIKRQQFASVMVELREQIEATK